MAEPRALTASRTAECSLCGEIVPVTRSGRLRVHPKSRPSCNGIAIDSITGDYELAARAAAALGLTVDETAEALHISPLKAQRLLARSSGPDQEAA